MKQQLLLWVTVLLVVMLCRTDVMAQSHAKYEKYLDSGNYLEGYVINRDSVVIKGLLLRKPGKEINLFSGIRFVNEQGVKNKYGPRDLKGFGYGFEQFIIYGLQIYRVVDTGNKVDIFLRVQRTLNDDVQFHMDANGMLSLYGNPSKEETYYYLKKKKGKLVSCKKLGFSERMAKYFNDCPLLSKRIGDKEFGVADIYHMVRVYESECE